MTDVANALYMKDPKAFMKQYLVNIDNNPGETPSNSGDYSFDLMPTSTKAQDAKGNEIDAYRLVLAKPGVNTPIPAYWLAYKQGKSESQMLTTANPYFFTAGLTGCGFAAGTGASPLVKHMDGDKMTNAQMVNDPSNRHLDIYTAENYGHGEAWGMATVFGIKALNMWTFWAQARLLLQGGVHKLRFEEGIMPV